MLNVGNVFNLSTWVVFGAVAISLSIRFKENKAQWFCGFVGAIVVGAIDTIVLFRLAVTSHSSTGGPILAALSPFIGLSDSRFERVYCSVASNQASPEPLLIQIYHQHPGDCDYALALNPKLPPEMLAALADSPTSYVRWAVSANPQTPRTVLLRLFEHREPEQTYWFLRNPNLPDDLRAALSHK